MATLTAKPFSMLYSYIDNHVKAILMAQKKVNSQLPVALYLIFGSHTPMNIGWFFKVKFPNFIFGGGGEGMKNPALEMTTPYIQDDDMTWINGFQLLPHPPPPTPSPDGLCDPKWAVWSMKIWLGWPG